MGATAEPDDLDGWRERIDALDRQIVALVSERACAAQAIGTIKRQGAGPLFVPHREREVFDRLAMANPGPLTDANLRAIWREIMSATLVLEGPLTVCHFGKPGSFTHQAARLKFGDSVGFSALESIAGVFAAVEKGLADYGIVPIENSTDGGITDTVDCFLDTSLCIIGEMHLRIRHHLMARCEQAQVHRIYSKNTVFGQCRNWLGTHMPGIELVDVASTTLAAERAMTEEGAAAIGNRDAADAFGLEILAQDTEDNPTNITRFVILAKRNHAAIATGRDKTSIMFAVKDRPGALYDALLPFRESGISLSRIESRPNRRQPWEYLFFIDILAHQDDPVIADALADLERATTSLQVLGSYPRSEEPLNP